MMAAECTAGELVAFGAIERRLFRVPDSGFGGGHAAGAIPG
jgi:hypothetical protein